MPVLLGLALGVLLLEAASASAVVGRRPPPKRPTVRGNTQMIVTGWTPGQSVTGFIADGSSTFDPTKDPYPAFSAANPPSPANPPADFTPKDEGYAGLIQGTPTAGGATLNVYCIDINTDTTVGIGYVLGSWEASGVPNVGFVERILNEYYPHNPNLPALANPNEKAAAVQAAIWFFSDKYVLSTDDPLHNTVAGIVEQIQDEGALPAPAPPTLTLTPSSLSAPGKGSVIGPFRVNTNQPSVTVDATGGTMYSAAAALPADQLGDGTMAVVHDGQEIWLRSTGPPFTAVLQATSTAEVPSGNVWLYDGNTAGWGDAQRLILAESETLTTTIQATAEFQVGKLVVNKTILGPAAGHQGTVVIRVRCDDGVHRRPFVIRAGAGAGTTSRTYGDIDAGVQCLVIETSNGRTTTVNAKVMGNGQEPTIQAGETATVDIKDGYRFVPGSLIVRKTITGPTAGHQGEITIHSECNGTPLTPDFVIPAGEPEGEYSSMPYDGIRTPATCTVTETVDGHTSTVSVDVEGSGQKVSIGPAEIRYADISDTYGLAPGQLEVTKAITGPQAGQQGPVVIHTVCTPAATTPDFTIAAGATGVHSQIYSGIPGGASCTVTEMVDGHTSTVSVAVAGSPHTVTIAAGGSAAATITDTYGATPGSLLVTKTIAGPSAGHQGPVTIHVVCDGTALSPDFVIHAGAGAGTVSHSFDNIPAGSVCTVTETADGATDTVIVTALGDDQTVTMPAGKVVPVSLTDVYDDGSPASDGLGSLMVIKHIIGPAARHHGRIGIVVACGGPVNTFAFIIPSRTGPGSVMRQFRVPSGSRCNVRETADGHTNTVAVVARGGRTVTVPAAGRAVVHLTDRFTPIVKAVAPQFTG